MDRTRPAHLIAAAAFALTLLRGAVAYSSELPPPPPLKDESVAEQLYLRKLYEAHNRIEVVDSNPDGTRRGDIGDVIFYNNSGTYKFCVNTDSGGGTTWVCSGNYSSP